MRRKRTNSNMVRVIEDISDKKYIRDMKMGRCMRVPERGGERGQSRGGRRRKERRLKLPELPKKKEKRRFRPGTVALWEILNSRNQLDF